MAENPESKESAEPEAPEWIKNGRWLIHHLTHEGQMIRQSPVAFVITSCLLAVLVHFWEASSYKDQITGLQTTTATLQATITKQGVENSTLATTVIQLREELKGTSPQLAALQANRDEIRKRLQLYYVQSGGFFNRPVKTAEEVTNLDHEVDTWARLAQAWVTDHMGLAAADKLMDQGTLPGLAYGNSFNQEHINIKNYLAHMRSNLSILIETAAWDGETKH